MIAKSIFFKIILDIIKADVVIQAAIKKDLETLGFKIHFLPLDFNNIVRTMNTTLDWEMVLMGFSGGGATSNRRPRD